MQLKTLATLLFLGLGPIAAQACPDNQYESCDPFRIACVCLPKIGGDVGKAAEKVKAETTAQSAGPVLAGWIQGSRNSAIGTAQPIPPNIRSALTGYVEPDILNRVRFKVGDNGVLNLAGLTIAYGDRFGQAQAQAVTLIDVVVFRNQSDAFGNAELWAHELHHVQQFRDWGVMDFGIRYARNSDAVEQPAYARGDGYVTWAAAKQAPSPFPPPIQGSGFPSGFGMQVCGCYGPTAGWAPEPRCQSGAVRANLCAGFCPAGGQPYAFVCQ